MRVSMSALIDLRFSTADPTAGDDDPYIDS